MYLSLAAIRFLLSLPAALAVGLLLLPRLIGEDSGRFKPAVAALALARALFGFALLYVTARAIFPADRPIEFDTLWEFTVNTSVGNAWIGTQLIAFLFAALAAARLFVASDLLDQVTLWVGVVLIAVVSVTGHAIDDGLPRWTQVSFLLHTAAGLTWLGGLLGLVWWMFTARGKPPEVAARLAERWSFIAKVAMAIVAVSGFAIAWENVGSIPNLLATPYGRMLTLKLVFLCAVLLAALALARYITRRPEGEFNVRWYSKVGAGESVFALALLSIAGYIAVITPASHETSLYWPLPFRLSYIATWGQNPAMFSSIWWWGIAAVVLAIMAALIWWTPSTRQYRLYATPAISAAAAISLAVSFATEAYTDTYDDPTQDYTAESVARGLSHFQEYCIGCHGAQGEGNGPLAKDLKNQQGLPVQPADLTAPHVGTHTIGDIFHWLTHGGQSGVMPAFGEQLDVDDRWDVINFLLMMSYSNRARFMSPQPMIQWLIAPDFALIDPEENATSLFKLRGVPTLVSFARCGSSNGDPTARAASVKIAHDAAKAAGVNQVTIYDAACPQEAKGREVVHPKAVETAYSVINRYPNETPSEEIEEAHFLVDRSGYIRARFRTFAPDDGNTQKLSGLAAELAREPLIEISLHSH
ncbi:CopD family protein [Methylocystis suflitae]|uniref:CopD family protein n=1 Tax=Methylocystis suflitae TaxID=2951405 RepID=UPI00210C9663|nr:c-type cytochrome [Methylocystis suflitae]MCQ4190586.1 c-type cytochrome [Methylocystis suflitae]